jgi:hypothetical protein
MKTRILIGAIASVLQTIVYYLVFIIGGAVGTMIHEPTRMTISEVVGFGVFLKFSITAFGIIILAMNLIDALVNRKKWRWGLLILVTVFYVIYWGQGINYIPLKTTLFLVAGLIAIYSKIPIERSLSKLMAPRASTNTSPLNGR